MAKQTDVTYFCDICGTRMRYAEFQFEARWAHSSETVTFDVCETCREETIEPLPADPPGNASLYSIVRKLFKKGLVRSGNRED